MNGETAQKIAESIRKRWARLTQEQREEIRANQVKGMKAYWARLSPEQRKAIAQRIQKTRRERATNAKS